MQADGWDRPRDDQQQHQQDLETAASPVLQPVSAQFMESQRVSPNLSPAPLAASLGAGIGLAQRAQQNI